MLVLVFSGFNERKNIKYSGTYPLYMYMEFFNVFLSVLVSEILELFWC